MQGLFEYFSVAVVYDLLQTNKNPKTLFSEILRSKNGYLKIIKKLPVASKPGKYVREKYSSKEQFLNKNKLQ